jgi:hypothetical protein
VASEIMFLIGYVLQSVVLLYVSWSFYRAVSNLSEAHRLLSERVERCGCV